MRFIPACAGNRKLLDGIAELEELLAPTKKAAKGLRKLTQRDVQKIKRKLAKRKACTGKHPVFGGRARLKSYNKLVAKKDPLAPEALSEYRSHRDLGYRSEGETARTGNKNFGLSRVHESLLIFTPEKGGKIPLHLSITPQRAKALQHKQLLKSCHMAQEGKLPVTVTIKSNEILFTYDNEAVEGFAFDAKSFHIAKKNTFDVASYKEVARAFYREQEARMSVGKAPDRILSLDLNPERIKGG